MYTILLVEDSPLIQAYLRTALTDIEDSRVVEVADCEHTALEAIGTLNPDLAVLDLQLKQGSGLGVLKRLDDVVQRHKCPQVVIFSNHSSSVIKHRCLALGANAFFDKSFQLNDLIGFVTQQARKK